MSWKLECCVCRKKETFGDAKDITYAKWRILAWQLHNHGEPLVTCPDCEYNPSPVEKKKDK